MNLDELRADASADRTDTVLLVLTDMQGRLQGKRMTARHFLDEVVEHGAEACNYLLAVDVDMNTVEGYAMSSWERGYGDFEMRPDLSTLRRVPWQEGTAMCLADIAWADHRPVVASPRQILRAQLERLGERGWQAFAGTELEFMVFQDTYEHAWAAGYRNLTPANRYNVDYSMLGTARVEPLIRRIRNAMMDAEMHVENSKGECNFGQHEINFRYAPVLQAADEHVIYKNGAKEIAAQEGMTITYMAKYDEREGNSCHIHLSLREGETPLFAADDGPLEAFMAGLLATLRELTLLLAPNVNSYKRFAVGSFAPTAIAWGVANRTCPLPLVRPARPGAGAARRGPRRRRRRQPVPGGVGAHRRRPARHRPRPVARAGLRGQRLPVRQAARARDAARGGGALRLERRRARRVRRRGRLALPQQRARRARGVRRGGDRLGALPRLRAPLSAG